MGAFGGNAPSSGQCADYNVIRLQFQLPRWGAFKKADALASEKPICQSDGFCVSSEHISVPTPRLCPLNMHIMAEVSIGCLPLSLLDLSFETGSLSYRGLVTG